MDAAAPHNPPHDDDPPPYDAADMLPPPADPPVPRHRVSPKAGVFGMVLFLAALGMLFAASMLGYVLIRVQQARELINPVTKDIIPASAPPLGTLHLPGGLWFSTVVILASSFTMHLALQNVRRERQARFRNWLIATLVLAGVFLLVQTPSLGSLLIGHNQADTGHTLLGFIFFLVIIHALHLVGGVIPLAVVTRNAHLGAYDHEAHGPVRYVTMYWHFLDVVWIAMFAVLLLTG